VHASSPQPPAIRLQHRHGGASTPPQGQRALLVSCGVEADNSAAGGRVLVAHAACAWPAGLALGGGLAAYLGLPLERVLLEHGAGAVACAELWQRRQQEQHGAVPPSSCVTVSLAPEEGDACRAAKLALLAASGLGLDHALTGEGGRGQVRGARTHRCPAPAVGSPLPLGLRQASRATRRCVPPAAHTQAIAPSTGTARSWRGTHSCPHPPPPWPTPQVEAALAAAALCLATPSDLAAAASATGWPALIRAWRDSGRRRPAVGATAALELSAHEGAGPLHARGDGGSDASGEAWGPFLRQMAAAQGPAAARQLRSALDRDRRGLEAAVRAASQAAAPENGPPLLPGCLAYTSGALAAVEGALAELRTLRGADTGRGGGRRKDGGGAGGRERERKKRRP
jgi:hypothetical protein